MTALEAGVILIMSLSFEEWEALCKRCGRCCFEKIEKQDGSVIVTDKPCSYLDLSTRECRIYERRFELCPDCLPINQENLLKSTWLPEDCGYVEYGRRQAGIDRASEKRRRTSGKGKVNE